MSITTLFVYTFPHVTKSTVSHILRNTADDSKIYAVIKTLEDSHKLQTDLNSIENWRHEWLTCSPEISNKTYSVATQHE